MLAIFGRPGSDPGNRIRTVHPRAIRMKFQILSLFSPVHSNKSQPHFIRLIYQVNKYIDLCVLVW